VHKRLTKAAVVIGLGTALSRILGLVRDIFIAKFFGTSIFADSFFVAFRIPNLLRDFIGEGATNAALVPVFSEYLAKREREDYQRLLNVLFRIVFFLLIIISILGIFFSPFIVNMIAPGFKLEPEKYQVTVKLTRIIFPYIFFIALTAFLMGVLHTHQSFISPAFSPVMLNLALILGVLVWTRYIGIYGLAWAVLLGGLLQVLIQVPTLKKTGFKLRWRGTIRHPGINKIGKLLLPRILGSCVYQINLFVDTILASLSRIVGEGGVSALYYANRLVQLPLAVFGISLAQAALPTMSFQSQENDFIKLSQTISFTLRGIAFITLPSMVGLIVLAVPLTRVLFQRGEFGTYSTQITSSALIFYSLGLFAYAGIKILVAAFYSLQDTFTPVKTSSLSLILNIFLNLILMFPLKVSGLALASAISALFNFFLLFSRLKKRIEIGEIKELTLSCLRILLASLTMGIVLRFSLFKLGYIFSKESLQLLVGVFMGIIFYIFFCFVFKVRELDQIKRWLLKR
ncbi:MAG: murein biosynthesis integral membrane protein MurJ, partial [Candidatus Omnitrophica bacterium]|nr:murein biosynthesis integral membrane protein MurJ [Candidatus Omnitrophota bacterium]